MPFGGGRTVGPHWGTNVKRTKSFWDPVFLGLNVWVELSLGPKMGGRKIKAPQPTTLHHGPSKAGETNDLDLTLRNKALVCVVFQELARITVNWILDRFIVIPRFGKD
jgi:hypothetical protein